MMVFTRFASKPKELGLEWEQLIFNRSWPHHLIRHLNDEVRDTISKTREMLKSRPKLTEHGISADLRLMVDRRTALAV